MAFQKFVLVRNETRRDNADAETGIIFGGYVYDTDHPAHPRRADFVIDGEEYEALSAVPETRAYQVEGIIKREVAALYAAWAATLGPAPEAPSTQPSPAVPVGEMLDLSNAATAYDPDINSWADGWGEPPAPSSPEFVSAALNLARTAVVVTFSEGMVSPAAGHAAGVSIKVNGGAAGIDSAEVLEGPETIAYFLFDPVPGGAAVTWEYNAGAGDMQDAEGNLLVSTGPHAVSG